jgi:HK97 gp10 family phage protein
MIDLNLDNQLSDLLKDLIRLEETLQNKVVRSGLVATAKPIKKDMKSLAPKRSGVLAASVNHKQLTKAQKQRVDIAASDTAIIVGPNKKANGTDVTWRANFIEEGVRPHDINRHYTRKLGRSLKMKIGGRVITGDVKHPGLKANPFMKKSIKQNESNIPNLFYKGMAKTLDRIRAQ